MISYRLWVYGLVTTCLPETRFFGLKATLLRWCGAKVGNNVRICSSAKFLGGGGIEIGDDVWIGSGDLICAVDNASVKIERRCDLGPGVMILTGSHKIDPCGTHIAGEGVHMDVEIGEGCWLGARSLILPGVKLASKTIVAAGAVVNITNNVCNALIAGVPAQYKKRY